MTIFTMIIVLCSTAVGLYLANYTEHVDSPIEQVAEAVLEKHGIDVDFSADKKNKKE